MTTSAPVLQGSKKNPELCQELFLVVFAISKCGIFSKSVFLVKCLVAYRLVSV